MEEKREVERERQRDKESGRDLPASIKQWQRRKQEWAELVS